VNFLRDSVDAPLLRHPGQLSHRPVLPKVTTLSRHFEFGMTPGEKSINNLEKNDIKLKKKKSKKMKIQKSPQTSEPHRQAACDPWMSCLATTHNGLRHLNDSMAPLHL
jgi:hypothetical protein